MGSFGHCDIEVPSPVAPNSHSFDVTVATDGILVGAWASRASNGEDTLYVARFDPTKPHPYWVIVSADRIRNTRFSEIVIATATGYSGAPTWQKAFHVAAHATVTSNGRTYEDVWMFSGPYDINPTQLGPAPRMAEARMHSVAVDNFASNAARPSRSLCQWQLDVEIVNQPLGRYTVAVAMRYPETFEVTHPTTLLKVKVPSDSIFLIYSKDFGWSFNDPPSTQPIFVRIAGWEKARAVNWNTSTPAQVLWGLASENPNVYRTPYAVFSQPRLLYTSSLDLLEVVFGGFVFEPHPENPLGHVVRSRTWLTHSNQGNNLFFENAGSAGWFAARTPSSTPCTHPTIVKQRVGHTTLMDFVCITSKQPDVSGDFVFNPNRCGGNPTGTALVNSTWDAYLDVPLWENPRPLAWFEFTPPSAVGGYTPIVLPGLPDRLDLPAFQVVAPVRARTRGTIFVPGGTTVLPQTFIAAEVADVDQPWLSRIRLARMDYRVPAIPHDNENVDDAPPFFDGRRFYSEQPALGVNHHEDLPTYQSVGWFATPFPGVLPPGHATQARAKLDP